MQFSGPKKRVIDTVNALLERSGQSFPVKHISNSPNSVEVYDVEHWPDSFNTLLLHDFPSMVVSFDTSTASLSGFVITLEWKQFIDASEWVGVLVHIIVFVLCLFGVVHTVLESFHSVSHSDMQNMKEFYQMARNSSSDDVASFLLAEQLRVVMSQSDL
jgi:hypothetical protein